MLEPDVKRQINIKIFCLLGFFLGLGVLNGVVLLDFRLNLHAASQVTDLGLVVLHHEDIKRLEIPVDYIFGVHVLNTQA